MRLLGNVFERRDNLDVGELLEPFDVPTRASRTDATTRMGPVLDFSLEFDIGLSRRTFLRTAIGNASNSSSVVLKPVISFMFLRNLVEGRLREDCGRWKD